jgi:sodium-dependent phosphate cotransporter
VLILFPLELATGYLRRVATFMANAFEGTGCLKVSSPIKIIVKPAVHLIKDTFHRVLPDNPRMAGILMLILALVILFFALFFLVKLIKTLMARRTEIVVYNILGKGGIRGMILGIVLTAIVQSSSVTTSILVPLLGAGIITIEMALPVTLGANIGTTVTALLASLAGNIHGTIIAFAHLAFNITGIILIYPVKRIRAIPIKLARWIGETGTKHRIYAVIYILCIFFIIPTFLIFITNLFN